MDILTTHSTTSGIYIERETVMRDKERQQLTTILNNYDHLDKTSQIYWYKCEDIYIKHGNLWLHDNQAIHRAREMIANSIDICWYQFKEHTSPFIDWIAQNVEPRHLAQTTASLVDRITQEAHDQAKHAEEILEWLDTLDTEQPDPKQKIRDLLNQNARQQAEQHEKIEELMEERKYLQTKFDLT